MSLRFRQIHLDFHTSPHITGIGTDFDPEQWQATLQTGHVDSVTLFATCHHGYAYYDTQVGERHPHLSFDLLRAQVEATQAIGVKTPVYLTAGVNNWAAEKHPEWREIGYDGRLTGWSHSPLEPGFHRCCFNTPYLDLLCAQIEEVVTLFPNCDGIFLDIISQGPCCCKWCLEMYEELGLDPENEEDRQRKADAVLWKYYERTTAAAKKHDPGMPIFHNSGHIAPGKTDILKFFSHLELESLPTGGWGYDHFPMSARYAAGLPHDTLGMTGKFHTTWGEFGGYKHPNALRYECAAMIAHGTKCSVGDQLHPSGKLDESTYKLIGTAYAEVEAKEPYCVDAKPVADIGLISHAACDPSVERESSADVGAGRVLLEGQYLFDVIEPGWDFASYKLLILPDAIPVDQALGTKLAAYLEAGGKLLITGQSGVTDEGTASVLPIGATLHGPSPFMPDFVLPDPDLRAEFCDSPLVMYRKAMRLKATEGVSLGAVHDPYFNRTYRHFSSHQHTPYETQASGFDLGVRNGNVVYLAHPWFTIYAGYGAVAYRQILERIIDTLLGGSKTLELSLPSTGRATLTHQPQDGRHVLHLLHAAPIQRGGPVELSGGNLRATQPIQVVEELLPLHDIQAAVRGLGPITTVRNALTGDIIPHEKENDAIRFEVDRLEGHAMLTLETR
ncbi:MAG: alpha-amylase family protein [Planctomycetota bacterium]